ncbi:MAG: T9SS type A sorting domain-containing protein, partial [Bacteroidales bacterium]|nr:T9SS type A sorting domain-containing protein [Bacteroidales bacterium]
HADWTKTNVANAVYTWNASTGSYASYVAGAAVNGGSRYIAPMQGFFVQAVGSNPSLTIDNNNVRVDQAASFLKEDIEVVDQLSIKLISTVGTDEIIVRFLADASSVFDADFDAYKMFGNANLPQLFAIDETAEQMAIHSLNNIKETEFVSLGLMIEESGEYSMQFSDLESFTEFVTITLEDKKTQTFQVLSSKSIYEFDYEAGEDDQRFILHFKDVTATHELNELESFAYMVNSDLYVKIGDQEGVEAIQLYNMSGQLVKEQNIINESIIKMEMHDLSKAGYIIKTISKSKVRTQKFIY